MSRTPGGGLHRVKDPDGHPLALSYGFEIGKEPVRYTRELNIVGLGHVLLTVKDTQRSHDFYTGVLGFRLSDWVHIDDAIRLCFLRCNARHHSIAFAPCMPGKSPRLQHVMLEVEALDDVMRSYHFLRACKAPIGMGPGRHPNCQTVHVYVQTPGDLPWNLAGAIAVSTMPTINPSSILPALPSISGAATSRTRNSNLVSLNRKPRSYANADSASRTSIFATLPPSLTPAAATAAWNSLLFASSSALSL